MDKQLPARPNLDHLQSRAKTLLAKLADGGWLLSVGDDRFWRVEQFRIDRPADVQRVLIRGGRLPSDADS